MTDTERIARLDAIRERVQADADDTGPLIRQASVYGLELLTHARDDIPWLLAEIERLQTKLDAPIECKQCGVSFQCNCCNCTEYERCD